MAVRISFVAKKTQPYATLVLLLCYMQLSKIQTCSVLNGNATTAFLCTVFEVRNISYCCQQIFLGLIFLSDFNRVWSFSTDFRKVLSTRNREERPHYLSRVDHERKIRNRRQRTDIGKHSFVKRTIRHGNQLPAQVLGTLPCKQIAFKKRLRKVLIGAS